MVSLFFQTNELREFLDDRDLLNYDPIRRIVVYEKLRGVEKKLLKNYSVRSRFFLFPRVVDSLSESVR